MSSPEPYHHGRFNGQYNSQEVVVAVALSISLYNAIELIVLVFTTFQKWRGLYFYSLLTATFGLFPYCIGFFLECFTGSPDAVSMSIDAVGWVLLISGQSVVLYSRLHLVLNNPRILKAVKWMIIIDAIVLHTSTIVLLFGASYGGQQAQFQVGYKLIEKIQMTMFCAQEFILSGLYLWKTIQILQATSRRGTRRVMWQLFSINVLIIVLDIGLLAIEYKNYHLLEQTIKGLVYSVKLKLEFAILGKLVEVVQSSKRLLSNALFDADTYIETAKTTTDTTKVSSERKSSLSRPKWMEDLEKYVVEQREDIGCANAQDERKGIPSSKIDHIEGIPIPHQSVGSRRRTRGERELMYAEAMRELRC